MGTYHTAFLKTQEETAEANSYQAGCLGTEIAAKKVWDQTAAETRLLEAKVEASKPNQDHLGRMGQALIEGSAAIDQSAAELLARN
eukprot:9994219-Heterocapsa_arctica.AAC.1